MSSRSYAASFRWRWANGRLKKAMVPPLMQNRAEPDPRRVAAQQERAVEVRELQDRRRGECVLQGIECLSGRRRPRKGILLQKAGEARQ